MESFFSTNPIIAALFALAVVGLANFVVAVYQSLRNGSYDPHLLPVVLDTLVLQKLIPLTALGFVAWVATAGSLTAYIGDVGFTGGVGLAILAEVNDLKNAVLPPPAPAFPSTETTDADVPTV